MVGTIGGTKRQKVRSDPAGSAVPRVGASQLRQFDRNVLVQLSLPQPSSNVMISTIGGSISRWSKVAKLAPFAPVWGRLPFPSLI
jgi:hypothetical protein